MNKKRIIVLTLLTFVVLSIAMFIGGLAASQLAKQNVANSPTSTKSTSETSPTNNNPDSTAAHTPGMYMDYDQASYDAHAEQRRVLFFHAPWCPQCVALDKDIAASDLPDDVAVFIVDYDSNQELRKKYGVTLQTTLVLVDANGDQVKKYTAYATPNYESVKTNLLD